jgi:hypothetical protein
MTIFKQIQELANNIRIKAYLANLNKGNKSPDEYMNEIIDLNEQIEEIYSTKW